MATYPSDALRKKVSSLPAAPGCYLFKDAAGRILYVGKSKALRGRVRSYFAGAAAQDERIADLVRQIRDVEHITTETELDALIREYLLIRQHKPWFNSQFVRVKVRPYLRIDRRAAYPTLSIAAEAARDGAAYFGTFQDRYDAEDALQRIGDVFRTPRCGLTSFAGAKRACLYHQMAKCDAPCIGAIDAPAYQRAIEDLIRLLTGEEASAVKRLRDDMQRAALAQRYEHAAKCKAALEQLDRIGRKCRHHIRIEDDTNALLFMQGGSDTSLSVFDIRRGDVVRRTRIPCDAPAGVAADLFLRALGDAGCQAAADDRRIDCLLAIHTKRRFVPLGQPDSAADIRSSFKAGYAQFVGE